MLDKVKQLMEIKRQAENIKRELEALSIEVAEGDGVTVEITGAQQVKRIVLDDTLFAKERKDQLEVRLVRSVNSAIRKSQECAAQKMRDVAGLSIPGL